MRRRLGDAIERANGGDVAEMSVLRQWMKQCPSVISQFGGDLAEVAAKSLIGGISGKNLVWKEAILQQLDLMRVELAGPSPSAIEKLLVAGVVTCWLQVQHADYMVARSEDAYSERRQDRAHRRLLRSVKTLADVRRLALPIQVDVNVTASVETKTAASAQSRLPSWDRIPSSN